MFPLPVSGGRSWREDREEALQEGKIRENGRTQKDKWMMGKGEKRITSKEHVFMSSNTLVVAD